MATPSNGKDVMLKNNPLKELVALGQSVWLDDIGRDMIKGSGLRRLIAADGLRGMALHPSTFEKVIMASPDYDADIQSVPREGGDMWALNDAIAQRDVQTAADAFRPLYDRTDGNDGYVSLEVNPHLAHDTRATLEEARRLWSAMNRPNIFIKVPATDEGLPAIRQLISEGINVNVTLLFGLTRYWQVVEAYIAGLEARSSQGLEVRHVASVASFCVGRLDARLDPVLQVLGAQGGKMADVARAALGQVAIASAKLIYQVSKMIFGRERFKILAVRGARVQRLLWAGTSAKTPECSDVKYVEALIGPNTVSALTPATFAAFRDHGVPQARLEQDVAGAARILSRLPELGISLDEVARQQEDEDVEIINQPFEQRMTIL